ncbi:MAG: cobalamin-dependent protein [Candidatus Thiodiazotropha sp. (ex Monitilora ramsayi)]|nr:cobalamin-dependent protein [Candidatus Thiodiazotropha sp. (ex Monitilora ramsayi)]
MAQAADMLQASLQTHWNAPLRFITSTALYDGHDASINVIRRLLLEAGAEVIHLGHNHSVYEIVRTALQEDADAIAVSSYQGSHMDFFPYLVHELDRHKVPGLPVFAGGGGTMTAMEAGALEATGVTRVYTAEHGLTLGLQGMIDEIMKLTRTRLRQRLAEAQPPLSDHHAIAQTLSCIEQQTPGALNILDRLPIIDTGRCPVVGITGTGGAGKSCLIDELLARFFTHFKALNIACLTVDPTRHRTGGAMLGDRIRFNNAGHRRLYLRSMATRRKHRVTGEALAQCIAYIRSLGFDLVMVETAGTGQSDADIAELSDVSVYVMTSDYGAPSQLEKIEMLGYADLIVLNKADRQGAMDAVADVQRQWRDEHQDTVRSEAPPPVFATQANHSADNGVDLLFASLCDKLQDLSSTAAEKWTLKPQRGLREADNKPIIPGIRKQYLAEIVELGHSIDERISVECHAASEAQAYYTSLKALDDPLLPDPLQPYSQNDDHMDSTLRNLRKRYSASLGKLTDVSQQLLRHWPSIREQHEQAHYRYTIRNQEYIGENYTETLSHSQIPKIALPHTGDWGELLRFLTRENLPGYYPYTAGVFPYRRTTEDPTRMFAGEGIAERTNHRFHLLARDQRAIRLSTAFDPVALYGEDPDGRPDVYGCIGMSGVSVATLDDFKRLYSGFDLCRPNTSVSMTINGPGPIALACFMNTAIDQQVEKWLRNNGRWEDAEQMIQKKYKDNPRPVYRNELPDGHDGLGLGLLGVSGDELVGVETYEHIKHDTLRQLRGTLQADILKEDQAQNECLFPIEFSLRLMGDVQQYITDNEVRNYYSVSISGYHIAEAGANPITQLAFTLANGFTLVEYFLARGMHIDDFASHLSFFFSNGLDAEYAVIGRVARRIWARTLRDRYDASERSQRLKYHIQTSGRSLHAREFALNDIRTTLQALYAIHDNCNSLHTNAADEAVTTPTEASVRRALAIQMIINREFGLGANENILQGSFIIEALTNLVETAVYHEFERLSERGGVLPAMEALYQRRRIQEESLYYEQCKNDGRLPIVGVNTFIGEEHADQVAEETPLTRATDQEKQLQISDVSAFRAFYADQAPKALESLQRVAASGGNVFAELLNTVRVATWGQMTHALYEVAGRYRRSM